jgi:hypothetical protein
MREKDRRRARERRLATFSQGEWQIYSAFHCCNLYKAGIVDGPVAQGIEQQPSKLKVAGSNPAGVANKFNNLACFLFLMCVACVARFLPLFSMVVM